MEVINLRKPVIQKPTFRFELNVAKGYSEMMSMSLDNLNRRVGIFILNDSYPCWKDALVGMHRGSCIWSDMDLYFLSFKKSTLSVQKVTNEFVNKLPILNCDGLKISSTDLSLLKLQCEKLKFDWIIFLGGTSDVIIPSLLDSFHGGNVIWIPKSTKLDEPRVHMAVDQNGYGYDFYSDLVRDLCYTSLNSEKFCFYLEEKIMKESYMRLRCSIEAEPQMVLEVDQMLNPWNINEAAYKVGQLINERRARGTEDQLIVFPPGICKSMPELYGLLMEMHALHKCGVKKEKLVSLLSKDSLLLLQALPHFLRREILNYEGPDYDGATQKKFERLLCDLIQKEQGHGTSLYTSELRFGSPSYSYAIGNICARILKHNFGDQSLVWLTTSEGWRCGGSTFLQNQDTKGRRLMVDLRDYRKKDTSKLNMSKREMRVWFFLGLFIPLGQQEVVQQKIREALEANKMQEFKKEISEFMGINNTY